MSDKHWNDGNTYAAKSSSEKSESYIHARCKTGDKAKWVKQARKNNMKLTEWIVQTLNKSID